MVRAYRFSCFTVVAELCNSFVSSTVMIWRVSVLCVMKMAALICCCCYMGKEAHSI